MKYFLALFFSLLALIACSDDNPNNNGVELPDNPDEPFTATAIENGEKVGAFNMPYKRYESNMATLSSGAIVKDTYAEDQATAFASGNEYVELPVVGASVGWTVTEQADGVVIRFTLPDNAQGTGTKSQLDVLVNDDKVATLDLTSYWLYQYFEESWKEPVNVPTTGYSPKMFFDETRILLDEVLQVGDKIAFRLASGEVTGIDFVEMERVDPVITKPNGAISVTDAPYNAVPNNAEVDNFEAFRACIQDAAGSGKAMYIPEGVFYLSERLEVEDGLTIIGAGMWHTELYFYTSQHENGSGGFHLANKRNVNLSHFYLSSRANSRVDGFDAFRGVLTDSKIEHIWAQHFTCGVWFGYYSEGFPTANNTTFSDVRLRILYADGLNLAHGSSNCTVEHSNIRGAGDDGLASFSSLKTKPCSNNTFKHCTVELGWRAAGVGIFGGEGHRLENLLVEEHALCSGIRFNSTFDATGFNPENPISVSNCIIRKSGHHSAKGEVFGALEIGYDNNTKFYPVEALRFRNIDIKESFAHGIRITAIVKDVTFDKIVIDQTGIDKFGGSEGGSGIYLNTQSETSDTNVAFSGVVWNECAYGNVLNVGNSYNVTFK